MRAPRRVRAVTLDAGGTLIEPWPSVGHVYASVARQFGVLPSDPVVLEERFRSVWRATVGFDYSRRAWGEVVASAFGGSTSSFGSGTPFFDQLYAAFAEPGAWKIYDDVLPALKALRDLGLNLAVISNWDDRLGPLLQRLGLEPFFDSIQISGRLGIHKPAPEIFLATAQSLGVCPEEVLHVGDSLREDIAGAIGAGMRAVLVRRGMAVRGPKEIASLLDVPDRLKSEL